jgi:hypothetical protein
MHAMNSPTFGTPILSMVGSGFAFYEKAQEGHTTVLSNRYIQTILK